MIIIVNMITMRAIISTLITTMIMSVRSAEWWWPWWWQWRQRRRRWWLWLWLWIRCSTTTGNEERLDKRHKRVTENACGNIHLQTADWLKDGFLDFQLDLYVFCLIDLLIDYCNWLSAWLFLCLLTCPRKGDLHRGTFPGPSPAIRWHHRGTKRCPRRVTIVIDDDKHSRSVISQNQCELVTHRKW